MFGIGLHSENNFYFVKSHSFYEESSWASIIRDTEKEIKYVLKTATIFKKLTK